MKTFKAILVSHPVPAAALNGETVILWGYYSNQGKQLNYTLDKQHAELLADGYTWDNPRVRPVGKVTLINPIT